MKKVKEEYNNYMSDAMKEYFRQKLINWHQDINDHLVQEEKITIDALKDSMREPDHLDSAALESIMQSEVFSMNSSLQLIAQIKEALSKIEDGTYGFCEITGAPIGFRRLDAWPVAKLSIEAQEQMEA
jgi:DnaK suppressor protein